MLQSKVGSIFESALASLGIDQGTNYKVEVPPRPEMGDLAANIAIVYARQLSRNPMEVAGQLVEKLGQLDSDGIIERVEIAKPGFINIFLNDSFIQRSIPTVIEQDLSWGHKSTSNGQKVLLEFVSANPTGPLHVGHGRWAVIGDAIGRLLKAAGYSVESEFFVNNVGNQVEKLEASVKAVREGREVPEGGYGGAYVKDIQGNSLPEMLGFLIGQQQSTLDQLRVKFDRWYYESSLHDGHKVLAAVEKLKSIDKTFTRNGAVWFKSQEQGDDKDRVLVREDGRPTYFASDIAYHLDKFARGYDLLIDIWGTDHHGYVSRIKAALAAAGLPVDKLEIIIGQLVTLYRGDQPIRMSKRTGEMVSLQEVIDEIGADATRFFFSATAVSSHLDFDLELAKKKSADNPVFYLQYGHARICSILAKSRVTSHESRVDLTTLTHPAERALMLKLLSFPDLVETAARLRQPHRLTEYGQELAILFHSFYEQCRVLGNPARLLLVDASRITLRNVLELLGITAPESM